MKNYIQPGDTITIPAPAAVESGDGVKAGVLFGVAVTDADEGDDVAISTRGVFELPKTSAQAWTVGAAIYWTGTAATTATTAGNLLIGTAAAAAANPSATGLVRLNGSAPAAVTS